MHKPQKQKMGTKAHFMHPAANRQTLPEKKPTQLWAFSDLGIW
jgi:hypothetical protein